MHETQNSIRFNVSRPGVPVVVRTSYFPNWSARGAQGPWRLTPNLMVVVPTGRTVVLHFDRSGSEKLGGLLSLGGLAGLAGLVVWDARLRSRRNRVNRTLSAETSDGPGPEWGGASQSAPTQNREGDGATIIVPS